MMFLGNATYKGAAFSFGFDGDQLEFVPRPEERSAALALEPGFSSGGVYYSAGSEVPIESGYLELNPSNSSEELNIFPNSKAFVPTSMYQSSFRIRTKAYFYSIPAPRLLAFDFTRPIYQSVIATERPLK